jgi:import receptor subunit TOM20
LTGVIAYAAYFDHRRRTDPQFRKSLKKQYKNFEKQRKANADAANFERTKTIRKLVEKMNTAGYPSDPEEQETYFLKYLALAEKLQSGELINGMHEQHLIDVATDPDQMLEAACCFFRALKVYPRKSELISIIDSQVKKVCTSAKLECLLTLLGCFGYPRCDDQC